MAHVIFKEQPFKGLDIFSVCVHKFPFWLKWLESPCLLGIILRRWVTLPETKTAITSWKTQHTNQWRPTNRIVVMLIFVETGVENISDPFCCVSTVDSHIYTSCSSLGFGGSFCTWRQRPLQFLAAQHIWISHWTAALPKLHRGKCRHCVLTQHNISESVAAVLMLVSYCCILWENDNVGGAERYMQLLVQCGWLLRPLSAN